MKISILIPTRNGSPFIEYCLKTCVAVDDPDVEIIVSDNFSTDDTRQIAERFLTDPRVRYYNTGESVSMRRNYEFGLSKATGDYVMIIGDDDGIVEGAIPRLKDVIRRYDADAVNWHIIGYTWPGTISPGSPGDINYDFHNLHKGIEVRNAAETLRLLCAAVHEKYKVASNLYHGCVRRSLIDSLRSGDGTFFEAHNPDVYSSMAILSRAKTFLTLGYPVTIGGESRKSTGRAMLGKTNDENVKIAGNFIGLAQQDAIVSELPMAIRSVVAITYACLCRVNEKVCGGALPIDHEAWRGKIVRHMRTLPPEKQLSDEAILHGFFSDKDPDYVPNGPFNLSGNALRETYDKPPGPVSRLKRRLFGIPAENAATVLSVAQWFAKVAGPQYDIFESPPQDRWSAFLRFQMTRIKARIV